MKKLFLILLCICLLSTGCCNAYEPIDIYTYDETISVEGVTEIPNITLAKNVEILKQKRKQLLSKLRSYNISKQQKNFEFLLYFEYLNSFAKRYRRDLMINGMNALSNHTRKTFGNAVLVNIGVVNNRKLAFMFTDIPFRYKFVPNTTDQMVIIIDAQYLRETFGMYLSNEVKEMLYLLEEIQTFNDYREMTSLGNDNPLIHKDPYSLIIKMIDFVNKYKYGYCVQQINPLLRILIAYKIMPLDYNIQKIKPQNPYLDKEKYVYNNEIKQFVSKLSNYLNGLNLNPDEDLYLSTYKNFVNFYKIVHINGKHILEWQQPNSYLQLKDFANENFHKGPNEGDLTYYPLPKFPKTENGEILKDPYDSEYPDFTRNDLYELYLLVDLVQDALRNKNIGLLDSCYPFSDPIIIYGDNNTKIIINDYLTWSNILYKYEDRFLSSKFLEEALQQYRFISYRGVMIAHNYGFCVDMGQNGYPTIKWIRIPGEVHLN